VPEEAGEEVVLGALELAAEVELDEQLEVYRYCIKCDRRCFLIKEGCKKTRRM
jgi:hypothetical protein